MLITIFFNLTYSIVHSFLGLFQEADLGLIANITNAIDTAGHYISSISFFAPVETLLIIVGLWLVLELIMLTIKIINWVIRKIPTIS